MDTDPTTIVVLVIVYAVILVGGYVWLSLALSRVFPKLGEEGWKAWVPVLREMTVFQLGGYSAAWVVALFLPFINIIGLVVTVLAVHRINATLGRGTGFTVLAVVAYPVWATIVGFTNADRTPRPVAPQDTGYRPFAALPQTASATGVISDPPASAAPARTFGAGSPFDFSPQATNGPQAPPLPPTAAAPPAPFPSTAPRTPAAVPPAPPQSAGQIAFQPVARVAPPAPPAPPVPPVAPPAPSGVPVPPPAPPALVDPAPAPTATAWSAPAAASAPAAPPAPPVRPVPVDSTPPLIAPVPAPIVVAPLPPAPAAAVAPTPSPITAPTAFPTLPTSSADGVFDDLPAAAPDDPSNQVSDLEATITPATAPEAFESDLDDDFEDTVIVNRREELWVLSPEGAEPIRVTRPVALLGRNPSVSAEHPDAQLIRLTDPARTVSKTHARIELVSGAWLIIDLASTNGVYLDDDGTSVELEADVPTTLTPAFRLGELAFRLEREE